MRNNSTTEQEDLISIGEAAEYLGVSIDTLRRWETKGRIAPIRSPGGHRYYKKHDLDQLFGKRYTRDNTKIIKSDIEIKNTNLEEEKTQVSTTTIVETFQLQGVLSRPVRPVEIPKTQSIKIRMEKVEYTQTSSILFPSSQTKNYNTPLENIKKGKKAHPKSIYFVTLVAISILLFIFWYILWKKSQTVISPIP
jgi:excisionase family DNA binding protein